MGRTPKWKEVLRSLWRDQRVDVVEGELLAYCGNRESFYTVRRILKEMGFVETRQRAGGPIIYHFDWEVIKKHPLTRDLFNTENEEEGEA